MTKYFFLYLLLFSTTTQGQSIAIDGSSIGFIVLENNTFNGTGFVLNNKRQVVTCAHVIDTTKTIFFMSDTSTKHLLVKRKLRIVKLLPQYDLALLQSEEDLCIKPMMSANNFNFTAYQHLFYAGYDIIASNDGSKTLQVNNAYVSSVGKTFNGPTTVDFIEFNGVGIPGYSGGPVLNDEGKVVGVMREAWLRQGLKGGQSQLMNRAYSIQPIMDLK